MSSANFSNDIAQSNCTMVPQEEEPTPTRQKEEEETDANTSNTPKPLVEGGQNLSDATVQNEPSGEEAKSASVAAPSHKGEAKSASVAAPEDQLTALILKIEEMKKEKARYETVEKAKSASVAAQKDELTDLILKAEEMEKEKARYETEEKARLEQEKEIIRSLEAEAETASVASVSYSEAAAASPKGESKSKSKSKQEWKEVARKQKPKQKPKPKPKNHQDVNDMVNRASLLYSEFEDAWHSAKKKHGWDSEEALAAKNRMVAALSAFDAAATKRARMKGTHPDMRDDSEDFPRQTESTLNLERFGTVPFPSLFTGKGGHKFGDPQKWGDLIRTAGGRETVWNVRFAVGPKNRLRYNAPVKLTINWVRAGSRGGKPVSRLEAQQAVGRMQAKLDELVAKANSFHETYVASSAFSEIKMKKEKNEKARKRAYGALNQSRRRGDHVHLGFFEVA